MPVLSRSLRPLVGLPLPWLIPSLTTPVDAMKQAALCRREDVLPTGLLGIGPGRIVESQIVLWVDRLATGRIGIRPGATMNLEACIQVLHAVDIVLGEPAISIAVTLHAMCVSRRPHLLD